MQKILKMQGIVEYHCPLHARRTFILTHWGRVMQICIFTLQLCKMD